MNKKSYEQMHRIAAEIELRACRNGVLMTYDEATRRALVMMGLPLTGCRRGKIRKSAVALSVSVVFLTIALIWWAAS